MKESKFAAKALMLCPICRNQYYSELEVTVPDNYMDMKKINTARDNNGDIVHLDICSSAAPIKKEPCHNAIDQIGEKDLPKMDRKRLLEIMAQAYCVIPNKHKVMDSNLVIAMCDTLIANQDELFEVK